MSVLQEEMTAEPAEGLGVPYLDALTPIRPIAEVLFMCRFSNLVLVLAVVAGIGSLVQAADNEKPANQNPKKPQAEAPPFLKLTADEFIKRFDKNGDGLLSKDELPPRLAPMFDKADTNGDGKLDKPEVERMLQVLRKRFAEN